MTGAQLHVKQLKKITEELIYGPPNQNNVKEDYITHKRDAAVTVSDRRTILDEAFFMQLEVEIRSIIFGAFTF